MRKPPGLHVKLKQGLRRRRGIGGTGSYGSSGSPSSLYSIFVRCVSVCLCGVSVVCIYGESKLKRLEG